MAAFGFEGPNVFSFGEIKHEPVCRNGSKCKAHCTLSLEENVRKAIIIS